MVRSRRAPVKFILTLLSLVLAVSLPAQTASEQKRRPVQGDAPEKQAVAEAEPEEPEPSADAAGEETPSAALPPQVAPPPALPESCELGCLSAETQGGSREHFWAEGFVDFQIGDLRIQADRLDLYESVIPSGGKSRRIVAVGNVVFVRGEERLAGERMEMDLATNRGVFENAVGYMEPGVFIEAERIERLDADTYRMTGARFTSCAQPNPRWRFTTSSATIHRDDKIVAKNVVFRVKSVPTFYLPYFRYPLKEDQRATGLLSPRFGYSELRGFAVGAGFFWATGRSHDQTFLLDYYSRFGTGLTHELRYLRRGGSGGRFRSNVVQRTDVEARDFDLDWSGVQDLPGSFRASLNVRRFSSTTFQQAYQDDLDSASIRRQGGSLNIQGRMLGNNVQLVTELNETFFGDELTRSIRRLPALRISRSPRRVGRTGIVLRYEARAERLSQGVQDLTAPYNRFDIAPEISRPMSTSFLQVNPRLGFRYTHYSGTLTDEGLDGPALDRPVFEATVNVRGPTFSRVFTTPGFGYSPRLKHQIGPEFNWIYRTAVDDFDLIPKFDGIDHLLGTNQLSYGLVQRVMAKRPAGKTGKLRTHELFLWRIFQTYYVQISEGQNEFDPNFSSAAFGADGVPAHYSPIKSRARFTPARGIRLQHDIEYDVNFNQFRVQGLSLRWSFGSGNIGGSWSRAERLSEVAEERVATRNTIRGAAQLAVAGRRLVLSASTDYDLVRDSMIRSSARLRYSVQCCGLMVEAIRFNFNDRDETQFRFAVELENIGSIGLGGDQGLVAETSR